MTTERPIRCYDYVNQPCPRVQAALRQDAAGLFLRATTSAAEREHAICAQLHVRLGALDVAADVRVEIGPVKETMPSPYGYQVTVFPLSWKSISYPNLFPLMHAKLYVYPLSSWETQIELEGSYQPPLGVLGGAIDAAVGHRIAEAAVLRFVQDVAALLRVELTARPNEIGDEIGGALG
jgi:hypothetical protein